MNYLNIFPLPFGNCSLLAQIAENPQAKFMAIYYFVNDKLLLIYLKKSPKVKSNKNLYGFYSSFITDDILGNKPPLLMGTGASINL